MNDGKQAIPEFGWSRRDKFRLWGMIALLGFVLYAIYWSADPAHWAWLVPNQPEAGSQTDEDESDSSMLNKPSADNVEFKQDAAPVDEPPRAGREKGGNEKSDENESAAEPEPNSRVISEELDALLGSVQDNTLGVRSDEGEAFYALLSKIRQVPDAQLSQVAVDETPYKVLMTNPEHYRGRLVTISGNVRRHNELPVDENDDGIEQLYEAWMFTADSGNDPFRVIVSAIPANMPLGESDRLRARVTGYFFKLQGYEAQSGLHTAPLLLGKELKQLPSSPLAVGPSSSLNMLLTTALVLVALAVGVMRWQTRYNKGRPDRRRLRSGRTEHFHEPLPEKLEMPAENSPAVDANHASSETANSPAMPGETDLATGE